MQLTYDKQVVFHIYKDGNQWCAVYPDFKNLQGSEAGFGDTIQEAITELMNSAPPK